MSNSIYRQNIIEHYKKPHNTGSIEDGLKGKLANRTCGDEIEVDLKFENDKLVDIKYRPRGCAISVAAASMLSDEIIGMTKEEILKLDLEFIQELLGVELTTSRIKCGTLMLDAMKQVLS